MAQTTVSIRMDETLKKEMEITCKELGMNMTTAFTIFAKKMSREKRIPFEVAIRDENGFTAEEAKELKTRITDIERGNGIKHNIIEVEQ